MCTVDACNGQGLCTTLFAGNWTGQFGATGQYGLSFVVTADARVTNLVITDSVSGGCGSTGLLEATGTATTLGADGSFTVSYSGCTPTNVCLNGTVRGAITPTGASGTFATTGTSSLIPLCFGSIIGASTAWQAAHDCSLRPQAGGSATRFCDATGAPTSPATPPPADPAQCSPCGQTQIVCSGQCVDPASDDAHCGAALGCGGRLGGTPGVACTGGDVCVRGSCAACRVQVQFKTSLPVAGSPSWFEIGDINNDGKVDIIYVEITTAGTAVGTSAFLNQGNFTFGPASLVTTKALQSLRVTDINGDGNMDLVGIDYGSQGTIITFLGNGAGGFTPGPTLSCGTNQFCRQIAVADLNEDGNPDIAAVAERSLLSPGTNQLLVMTGPTFGLAVGYPIGASGGLLADTGQIVAADFNNDHHLDLVVLAPPATIYSFINSGNGTGTLTGLPSYTIPKTAAGDLRGPAVGDFDGDGNLDILFGNTTAGVVAFGSGDGTFLATQELADLAASSYGVADLIGSGHVQVVSGPTLTVRQFSSRSTVETLWTDSHSVGDVRLRDLDQDGKLDVVSRGTGGLDVYRNIPCP
jgi:hypothetical protein